MYWGLVDSGAQISIISTGLARYLGLISDSLENIERSNFKVKGYDGVARYLPQLKCNLRLGMFGGEERAIQHAFCLLDTPQYKLLLGLDLLKPLSAVIDVGKARLNLQKAGKSFSLPVITREAMEQKPAIKEFMEKTQAAVEEIAAGEVELDMLVDNV